MGQQIGLGSLVGVVVGFLCWRGNQTLQEVSTFPDAFTFVMLAVLLTVAVRQTLRRLQSPGRSAAFQVGMRVAAVAGTVFGSTVVLLGLLRFTNPAPPLLAFGFLTAFGSALLCGAAAAMLPLNSERERAA